MALSVNSSIGVFSNWRSFDGTWSFKYITLTTDGRDAGPIPFDPDNPTPIETDKTKYPEGTLFFDSDVANFVISSSIKNVYIDKAPIKIRSSNIQYTSITGKHRCTIVFESKTPIDPGNLLINLGEPPATANSILYSVDRKAQKITSNGKISDITISRNADLYTLTFNVLVTEDSNLTDDNLNDNQVYVSVWNIAANTITFHTDGTWKTIISESDIGDLAPLIISFSDPIPANRIIYPPLEGSIKVTVQNPNAELFDIIPTVKLDEDSIGIIDGNPSDTYDKDTGTMTFYVRPINETGYVVVSAWLSVNNTEIDGALKNKTYATAMDGEWIGATEGRLIRFKQNVPKYLRNDNYASFIQSTEDFFNTVYTSLTNGKHISILEKFARINNFNDIKAMEAPLIDLYRKQYGIQVQPNNDDLNYYLRNKQLPTENQDNAQNLAADTDTAVLKNYVFRDITGLELNSFIKDIYKNIPYYNQMAGTYRGIKFILDQMGLCVKLVEIWSSRDIQDNFEHNEVFAREDELRAKRLGVNTEQLSDIGRYYLTSRFDVDVMETGLTFKEFNELSYNIVKLILKVKPIHRVLRKLAYVHVTNTDMHFQHFLLDTLGNRHQEVKAYKYTWNLFDKYAVQKITNDNGKNHLWELDGKIKTDMLFFPFTTIDARVYYKWNRYNAYGEDYGPDGAEHPTNEYADKFLNEHIYSETPEKKPHFDYTNTRRDINPTWPENGSGYVAASKNAYNNLFNIAEKLKRSKCNTLGISFSYVSLVSDEENQTLTLMVNKTPICVGSDSESSTEEDKEKLAVLNSINPIDLTFDVTDNTGSDTVVYRYKLIDYLLGKLDEDDLRLIPFKIPETALPWTVAYNFDFGGAAKITSETNGFRLDLMSGAQTILDEVGVSPAFNQTHKTSDKVTEQPLGLFAKIEDLWIALGTDYLIYVDNCNDIDLDYKERSYNIGNKKYKNNTMTIVEQVWFWSGWGTNYYLLKKGCDTEEGRANPDSWIKIISYPNAGRFEGSKIEIYEPVEEKDGYPIIKFEHTGKPSTATRNINNHVYDIDGHCIVHESDTTYYAYSDEDSMENPKIFKVLEHIDTEKLTLYRISDLAGVDFNYGGADAEFAVKLPVR